jgi:hypothetical protein
MRERERREKEVFFWAFAPQKKTRVEERKTHLYKKITNQHTPTPPPPKHTTPHTKKHKKFFFSWTRNTKKKVRGGQEADINFFLEHERFGCIV